MFDSNSRYKNIEVGVTTVPGPGGTTREVRYVLRRFLPDPSAIPVAAQHKVLQSDRMDRVAMRYFGDPTLWWRLCDANGLMNPDDLLEEPGAYISIPGVSGWQ